MSEPPAPPLLLDRPPAGERSRPGWVRRLWIYPLVLAAGLWGVSAWRRPPPRTPGGDLRGLLAAVRRSSGARNTFEHGDGFLHVFPRRGYVLILFVGRVAGLTPASHLTIDRRDDQLRVGLIAPAGERILGEAASSEALAAADLSVADLERTLAEVYGQPARPRTRGVGAVVPGGKD